MAHEANEEQIRDLVARMQAYQSRMDALEQQANLVQMTINDIDNAIKALSSLEGKGAGHEMLVPIGAGSYVFATVTNPDRVLVGLGAGVNAERSMAASKEIMQARRSELEKLLADASAAISATANELMSLQAEAQKYR